MTRSLARELGSRGITVNCVAPGFIDTDMTKALDEGQKTALLGNIPWAVWAPRKILPPLCLTWCRRPRRT